MFVFPEQGTTRIARYISARADIFAAARAQPIEPLFLDQSHAFIIHIAPPGMRTASQGTRPNTIEKV
jgi:hypothetical protein